MPSTYVSETLAYVWRSLWYHLWDHLFIMSAYFELSLTHPPLHYGSINTVLNISKNCHFLHPPTQSFCWRSIGMVHLQSVCECVWVQIGQTCLIWCRNVLHKFTLSVANLHHRLVDIYVILETHFQLKYSILGRFRRLGLQKRKIYTV